METTNNEEGLTPSESASPATYDPGKKRKNKKGAPSLSRKIKAVKKGHVTSPSTKKKGKVTPQSPKKKIPVHDEPQESSPANPSGIALIEEAIQDIGDEPLFPADKFQRIMIAYYFGTVCGCPEEFDWKKGMVDSVINKIRETFEIPIGTDFEYILRDVLWHKNQGTTYNGEKQL